MKIKNEEKKGLVKTIMDTYQPENVQEMQSALKDLFGPMLEAMLQGEMENHLGYSNNSKAKKETDNRRNGYIDKNVKTTMGEVEVSVPRDRDGSFNSTIVPKRTRDISDIEDKVISIRNITLMERLNDYLMDNIGNLTSSRSIAKYLSSNNEHISDKTINSYLNYLCNAFAFYKVRRYDIQGKKYLMTQNKYYLVNHTFKFARLGTKNMNYGKIYENIDLYDGECHCSS